MDCFFRILIALAGQHQGKGHAEELDRSRVSTEAKKRSNFGSCNELAVMQVKNLTACHARFGLIDAGSR